MKKIVFVFSILSVPLKIQKAREIVLRLTGNVYFTNPSPTLAIIIAAINALETAWEAAADGGKILRAKMKVREQELVDLMLLLENYVANASGGDEQKILSAGFDIKKTNTHSKRKSGVIVSSTSGQVELTAETTKASRSAFEWQYCKDPMPAEISESGNAWVPADMTIAATTTLKNLPLREKLWFRVRTILPKNEKSAWVILGSAFLSE